MNTTRFFLDWSAPLTRRVREYLIPERPSGPVDLGSELIIVPTRQAGRRLREALAQYCAQNNTALLSPMVVTPAFFLRSGEPTGAASQTDVAAIWANLLTQIDLATLAGLFPARPESQDFSWASGTGKMIRQLRNELADGGYRIQDVCENFADVLEETQRWRDLAELETRYLEQVRSSNKRDPIDAMISQAERPELPGKIKRVVIAAIPDPTPLMIKALGNIDRPISILVHAPESMSDSFDAWGRPLAEKFNTAAIDIPSPEANIILSESPLTQSHKTLQLIAAEAGRFGPADIAIGVADSSVIPYLSAELEAVGLPPFDPAGKPGKEHSLVALLEGFRQLVTEGSYKAFSAFLRHSDVLKKTVNHPAKTLEELDRFQNDHLPLGWDYVRAYLKSESEHTQYPNLQKTVDFIGKLMDNFETDATGSCLRRLLQTIYEDRILDPQETQDLEFAQVAQQITTDMEELESETVASLGLAKKEMLALLLNRLGEQRYAIDRGGAVIDLEGWLELPWNDAPYLIVTGMNEGMVPKTQQGDIFLPDSLRTRLGLRNDAQLLATDIFTLRELIESRKKDGRACFITGKISGAGEPLKPSRLLLRCRDDQLPERTRLLFGNPVKDIQNHPPSISFPLKISADLRPEQPMSKISVTRMKDYLACPFRFYLKHVLKMEALDDQKGEMDAMDFGSLIHHALHRMAQHPQMSHCEDETKLAGFLTAETETRVKKIYGAMPPLQVEIQLHAAKERLSAAAGVQAQLVQDGWEIIASERKFQIDIGGIQISGRIDRIDRHAETGRIRVLDYKTSEKASKPEAVHLLPKSSDAPDFARLFLAGKEKRWGDLQLPLYRLMLGGEFDGPIEPGYFNLPKAITETGIEIWEDFSDGMLASAKACAEGIVSAISNGIFWPPAKKVLYDDFAHLFPGNIEECVEFD